MTYQRPGFFVARIFNPILAFFTRLGFSPRGAQVLAVRGRTSGKWRTMPVNPLETGGRCYLVAPRGETQWVRNLRASGGSAELRLGRNREAIGAVEVPDGEKPPILRAYLEKWASETRRFFGVGANPGDDELGRIAPNHPVFRIDQGPATSPASVGASSRRRGRRR